MARPLKQTAGYFPHDANACSGDTLTILQNRFGNDGYAFWFKLLEKLTLTDGHYLDCQNPTKWQLFLAKMGVNELTGVEIINLLVEIKAIDEDLWQSKLIWCQNLVDNLADVYKNRRRKIPSKPVTTGNKPISTNNKPVNTEDNPITTRQSKVKESKLKESKLYGEFQNVRLANDEYSKLEKRFNNDFADKIERLSAYMASKGKQYKDHYATILNWEHKDERENPGRSSKSEREPKEF